MIKKRLLKLLSHSTKYIVFQVLWQWISLLCQILTAWSVGQILRNVLGGMPLSAFLSFYLGIIAGTVLVRILCEHGSVRASFMASCDVKRILRGQIYEKLLRLGASYRQHTATAQIVQMASEGVEQLETYYGKYLSQLFYSLLAPLTLFIFLCRYSLLASVVLFLFVPMIPVVIVIVQKIAKRILSRYWDVYLNLGDSFLENIQGMTVLKTYRADERAAEEMDREAERFRRITMKVLQMQMNSVIVMDVVAYGAAAAGMLCALSAYSAGRTDLPGAAMIIFLALDYFLPMRLLGSYFHIAMNGMTASDRIFAFLDLPEPGQGKEEVEEGPVSITMQAVRFTYPAREGEEESVPALKSVSLKAEPGKLIGIVGESGCGKSTAARILTGRLPGYEGHIYINGKELSSLSEESLLKTVTMISSGAYIFRGTVRDNLLMAAPDASEERLWQVLESVCLSGYLKKGSGLDTLLAEGGANFSGGQRQRLALARAILRDTPVYILDEATSNIDLESEAAIMEAVRKLSGDRTVILISHRLANVKDASRIYFMENGRSAESGTHKELMHWGGKYAALYRAQEELERYGAAEEGSVIQEKLSEEDGRPEERKEQTREEHARRSGAAIMGRLIVLVKPLAPVMLAAVLLGILGFLCSIFVSILAGGELVRRMGQEGSSPLRFGILLTAVAVLRGVFHLGEQYRNHLIAFRLLALIRHRVFEALRRLCPAKLETRDKGNLISILTSDIELLEVFYAHTISPIAIAFCVSLFMVFYLGRLYLPAGLIALAGYMTIGILIPLYIGRKNAQPGLSFRDSFGELNSYLLESMRGLDETIQYGDGAARKEGLDRESRTLSGKQEILSGIEALQRSVTDAAVWFFSLALYACILAAFYQGKASFSAVLVCIMALPNSFGPVLALSRLANDLGQTLASGERVLSLLEEEPAVDETAGRAEALALKEGMEAEQVTFGYGEEKILKNFSLTIPAGACIGIHGRSGCGKSTLLRLLMRFWDPDEGRILLEEKDLREIPAASLRSAQAFVAQETHLFHKTLAENIAVGRPDAGQDEIEAAARKAFIHDFIMELPEGYQTNAGELGDTLSEGQKQRIGLARAFLYDAPILLLDEPTSSLDALSEGMILQALEKEKKERARTVVLVSHRASAMSLADQVVEMTGKVS